MGFGVWDDFGPSHSNAPPAPAPSVAHLCAMREAATARRLREGDRAAAAAERRDAAARHRLDGEEAEGRGVVVEGWCVQAAADPWVAGGWSSPHLMAGRCACDDRSPPPHPFSGRTCTRPPPRQPAPVGLLGAIAPLLDRRAEGLEAEHAAGRAALALEAADGFAALLHRRTLLERAEAAAAGDPQPAASFGP